MTKEENAKETRRKWALANPDKIKEYGRIAQRKNAAKRKTLTGSTYDKDNYERYKHLHAKAHKKYYDRIRAEKIASGEILTKEQRKERAEKKYKENIEKAKADYRDNVDGKRDKAIEYDRAYQKKKYAEDPQWQGRYLREYRAKIKAEKIANGEIIERNTYGISRSDYATKAEYKKAYSRAAYRAKHPRKERVIKIKRSDFKTEKKYRNAYNKAYQKMKREEKANKSIS